MKTFEECYEYFKSYAPDFTIKCRMYYGLLRFNVYIRRANYSAESTDPIKALNICVMGHQANILRKKIKELRNG